MANLIELGKEVKDRVTGFTGIAVSRTTFLTGCDRYGVQKKYNTKKDDQLADIEMFDDMDLEVVGCGVTTPPKKDPPGGDRSFRPFKNTIR